MGSAVKVVKKISNPTSLFKKNKSSNSSSVDDQLAAELKRQRQNSDQQTNKELGANQADASGLAGEGSMQTAAGEGLTGLGGVNPEDLTLGKKKKLGGA